MAISKVEFGGKTLMDLTEDTVSEGNLLQGETAHDASGNRIEGKLIIPDIYFIMQENVLSSRKRYIQGKDSVVLPYLYEYNTTHITSLNQIHIDNIFVGIDGKIVEVKEQTLTLSSPVIGRNYYVQCSSTGVVTISTEITDSATSKCIGGFHYGRVRLSRTISNVTTGIVPNSVWTLRWRPDCKSPDAMVYLGGKLWGDIYLTRVKTKANTVDGIGAAVQDSSAYGAMPCTGAEGFCQFTFTECLAKVGKRLSYSEEFVAAADGSPIGLDKSNANAWSASTSIAKCGQVANAISFLNVVDLVGNIWKCNADKYELNNPVSKPNYAWHAVSDIKGDTHGPGEFGVGCLISGGCHSDGSHCGSFCIASGCDPFLVNETLGAWAVAVAK